MFAVPEKGFVRRNHPRRDYSGALRSPDATSFILFGGVKPSAPRARPPRPSSREPDCILAKHTTQSGESSDPTGNKLAATVRAWG